MRYGDAALGRFGEDSKMIWVKLIQDVLFFAVIMAFVFYLGMVYGMAAAHKIRRKEIENTGHLLLGYTLYKAKPVEKER